MPQGQPVYILRVQLKSAEEDIGVKVKFSYKSYLNPLRNV